MLGWRSRAAGQSDKGCRLGCRFARRFRRGDGKPCFRIVRRHQFAVVSENHAGRVARFKRDLRDVLNVRNAIGNKRVPQGVVFPRQGREHVGFRLGGNFKHLIRLAARFVMFIAAVDGNGRVAGLFYAPRLRFFGL